MSYRPICDVWICARPRTGYYGSYPSGFLSRARALLGVSIDTPLLHVCGGMVREHPFYGFGPNDKTIDLDPALSPDFLLDVRKMGDRSNDYFPVLGHEPFLLEPGLAARPEYYWPGALVDRPYTEDDAEHYAPGSDVLPEVNDLLRRTLSVVKPGGRVGFLDYIVPRPPKDTLFVALVAVSTGFGQRMRAYSVFEKPSIWSEAAKKTALAAVRGKGIKKEVVDEAESAV